MKIIILLISSLIPLLIGFIWYSPKVFGKAWMKVAEMDEEKIKNANMGLIFGMSFLFSLILAASMQFLVIHQSHLNSLFYMQPIHDPGSEAGSLYKTMMDKFGNSFRTFKHGMLHGAISGFFIALPVMGINALFERKSFKYIAIHAGYWILTFMLMGGVICAFF